ncbi:MAG: hypothetical protein Q9167_005485 [Letrouitia subvulpina]
MAKRTRDAEYVEGDLSSCIDRRFLASTQDVKDLCYEYDQAQPSELVEEETSPVIVAPAAVEEESSKQTIVAQAAAVAATSIADVPTTAQEIVCALLAHKLKKEIEQILPQTTIKELCGGKSTLQNEIIGDIGSEFGHSPDGAEDMPLQALGETLEAHYTGQLSKHSSGLVARLISSKMPARFNLKSIREYLDQNWGLGPSRQASVLLFAICSEPAARLPSIDAAKEYFDSLASRYAKSCGLILQAKSSQNSAQQASSHAVDPAFLASLSKEQQTMAIKQFKVLAEYLKVDPSDHTKVAELETMQAELQAKLDLWNSEFAEEFASGIKPCFDVRKGRRFNSWWNLARQDVIELYYLANNHLYTEGRQSIDDILYRIGNRGDTSLLNLVESLTELAIKRQGPALGFAPLGKQLLRSISRSANQPPFVKIQFPVTQPQTRVDQDGLIQYKEVPRLKEGSRISYPDLLRSGSLFDSKQHVPFVHLKSCRNSEWKPDNQMTDTLLNLISSALDSSISFAGKDFLVTGAGPGSIGAELVQGLLVGGARVIVTTSRAPSQTAKFYQNLYEKCGARGSELLVLPSNGGSARDCEALVDHIYSEDGLARNLDAIVPFAAMSENGVEIDELAAKSELAHRLMLVNVIRLLGRVAWNKNTRNISCRPTQVLLPLSPNHGTFGGDGLYSESKLGLESLLNRFQSESWSDALTICGAVIGWTRGTGLMSGNDVVAEAIESHNVLTFSQKEMAFNLLVLMTPAISRICEDEPIIADLGGGLGHLENCKAILSEARKELDSAAEIAKAVKTENEHEKSFFEDQTDEETPQSESTEIRQRSSLKVGFPPLPNFEEDLKPLQHLQGMNDLETTVVVVGFSELGPCGSSRTRWEMESGGKLTQAGYIEMAWMMNLIKHFDGETKSGHYVGWVDTKSGDQVHDSEVEKTYGRQIHEHSGIRLIDTEEFNGYDPQKKEYLQEIAVEEDLPEFDATHATAEAFKLQHGDHVNIRHLDGPDEYRVQIKSGAHILVPKAVSFERGLVAGQIPKGWNPVKYGIENDLIEQVDPVTLYTLCCVSEALYSAGITESLEIFKYIHLSEMGNFVGSSMGGTTKTRHMYKDTYLDKQVKGDVIQETYINTAAAWVNMLLLGSTGPIKTPVGACATGVESIDIGYESIISGKTKMSLVGGTDNFQEDEAYGFSTMKATVNTAQEFAQGREPSEMSRPTAESRAGFLESQGCGVQILCSASLALEMGLPIYGIIASSTMAADKISRSVPAPGQGVLSFARETPEAALSPLLNLDYRREQMQKSISRFQNYYYQDSNLHSLEGTGTTTPNSDIDSQSVQDSGATTPSSVDSDFSQPVIINRPSPKPCLEATAQRRLKLARKVWGNDFRAQDPDISPLRASLAVWGLTIDDLDVASLHGTSTKANDKNEPEVINKQMTHLRRTPGRPLLAVCQKSVTGHPKAPAAAWMLNGCLQILGSGTIPGNLNADNVDPALRQFEHLAFPTRAIEAKEVKSFLLTSFGFGQKGGQVVGVAPKYLFATLDKLDFEIYSAKVTLRKRLANQAYVRAVLSNSIFKAQSHPPYRDSEESAVFLDPQSRISGDSKNEFSFDLSSAQHISKPKGQPIGTLGHAEAQRKQTTLAVAAKLSKSWAEQVARDRSSSKTTVGIDMEDLKGFTSDANPVFIERNFTEEERLFASQSLDPHSTYVSRWCCKEAVFKSFGVASKGAGAAMKDIEIYSDEGVPKVKLHAEASAAAQKKGIQDVMLSLSHSDEQVIAVALALHGSGELAHVAQGD